MSEFLILTTLTKGTSSHPRFVIGDHFGRVWTGQAWSDDENDGLLFADLNELGSVCREILLGQAAEKLLRAVQNGGAGRPNLVALGW